MTEPTDRELLELAAKAVGYEFSWGATPLVRCSEQEFPEKTHNIWNPLDDDGDALRLAVKLGFMTGGVGFARYLSELQQMFDVDMRPSEATRRAIVRAAAEIGRGMP